MEFTIHSEHRQICVSADTDLINGRDKTTGGTDNQELLINFQPPDNNHQRILCQRVNIVPDEAHLGKILKREGPGCKPNNIYQTRGASHCFYRAISYYIAGTEDYHGSLRTALHRHMWANARLAENKLGMTKLQFHHYLVTKGPSNIVNEREWATDVEIFFMSHLLQTDIAVYRYGTLQGWHIHTRGYLESEGGDLPHHDNGGYTIYINNPNGDHYDVVLSTQSVKFKGCIEIHSRSKGTDDYSAATMKLPVKKMKLEEEVGNPTNGLGTNASSSIAGCWGRLQIDRLPKSIERKAEAFLAGVEIFWDKLLHQQQKGNKVEIGVTEAHQLYLRDGHMHLPLNDFMSLTSLIGKLDISGEQDSLKYIQKTYEHMNI